MQRRLALCVPYCSSAAVFILFPTTIHARHEPMENNKLLDLQFKNAELSTQLFHASTKEQRERGPELFRIDVEVHAFFKKGRGKRPPHKLTILAAGRQPIKWLSLAAAQRISSVCGVSGRRAFQIPGEILYKGNHSYASSSKLLS